MPSLCPSIYEARTLMPTFAPEMRAKLAESAFELFSDRGIRNVNVEEIASRAGVTKGSLYWHFKSKKELIAAACSHYYRTWQRRVHKEISRVSDPVGRLECSLRFSIQSCLFDKKNRIFTTELFALSLQDDEVRIGWAQFYDAVRELYVGLVKAACATSAMQVDDPRRSVNWMLHALEGIKQRAAFEPEICTPDERDAMVEGLMRIIKG